MSRAGMQPASSVVRYVTLACVICGVVLLYLLFAASANSDLLARNYPRLLMASAMLVLSLIALVGYQLWQLRRKLKNRVFGSKLTLRLVLLFMLMAVLPGAVVYGASVLFLGNSIESWFDVRVDKALEGGLNLGRNAIDNMLHDLRKKADAMAQTLAEYPDVSQIAGLDHLREQAGVQEATLFSERGALIAFSGMQQSNIVPELPSAAVLRQARLQQAYGAIESLPDKGLYLRVVVPVNVLSATENVRILQLMQAVPEVIAKDAEMVQAGYRDYQELSLSRIGLKRLFGLTLTLTLLLALLFAILLAFLLSERLSAPLQVLAEGTRAVAQGDFTQLNTVYSRDEFGVLTQSFNNMTHQLEDARAAVQRNQLQLEAAKAYLESILANLTTGVMSFDAAMRLRAVNPSAGNILDVSFLLLLGIPLQQWRDTEARLAEFADAILQAFQQSGRAEWEQQFEYGVKSGKRTLLLRGTALAAGAETGYVVVFDDITHLLQAQRDAAWSEVARRLAHEFKNPLTPIRLSAERMQHKLAAKLDAQDMDMLTHATQTIVNQVAALKSMVDAFSQYARLPEPTMRLLDLNTIVREVLGLYESPERHFQLDLTSHPLMVNGDPAQLRQVIHNLLQNAQDALADAASPVIRVCTEFAAEGVRLSVIDNGSGFPQALMTRLFEPYVTTKPKGTGLGLAIVKKIVEEHGGMIEIENIKPHGACIRVTLPAIPAQSEKAA
ncbi:MAG: ATP-binding protein [Pseudomonadota bacterium]